MMKTIIGNWSDPSGKVANWGKLFLVLNQDALTYAGQVAPREVSFQLDVNGSLPAGCRIWANDELTPTGTYYRVTVTSQGGGVIWGPRWMILSGLDPIDLNAIVPLVTVPPSDIQASSSVVTVPGLVGGVINTPVTAVTGSTPNAFITVSNQMVLAPGSNISLAGSMSQHSLTITINGMAGGAFSAGAGGVLVGDSGPVTNQLMLFGGNNITLSGSTDSAGMSLTLLGATGGGGSDGGAGPAFSLGALQQTATQQAVLVAGNNVTLRTATNPLGMSVYFDAESFSQSAHPSFTAGVGGTNTQGVGSTVTNHLLIAGGNNITISRTTNASGMTLSIVGQSQSAQPAFSAGLATQNTIGVSSLVTNRLYFAGGNNITLAATTNASGMTVTIEGEPEGTVGPGSPPFAAGLGGGNVSGHLGPVEDRLYLAGGSNITLSGSTSGGSMTISVSAASQSSQTFPATSHVSQLLSLSAIANIGLTRNTNVTGMTYNISAAPGGGGPGGGGAMSLVEGDYISIDSIADGAGTTATISAAGVYTGGSNFRVNLWSSVSGGSISGPTVAMTNYLRFIAGSNMFLSAVTAAPNALQLYVHARQASLVEGNANISISTTANNSGTTYSLFGAAGGDGGPEGSFAHSDLLQYGLGLGTGAHPGGSSAGQIGGNAMTGGIRIYAGSNITLSGATDTRGLLTMTIIGASPGVFNFAGGTAPGGTTSGGSLTWGTRGVQFQAGSNVSFNISANQALGSGYLTINVRSLSLYSGSNITLNTSTNSLGTHVTINGASGGGPGGAAGISWVHLGAVGGSVSGETDMTDLHMMDFHAGSNVTLVGSTGTHPAGNYGVIDIHAGGGGPGGGVFSAGLGTFVTQTNWSATTQGHSGPVTGRLHLAAGPFVTLEGATGAGGNMTVTVQAQKNVVMEYATAAGGSTAGAANTSINPGRWRLVAGSNVQISVASNTAYYQTVTINVPNAQAQSFAFNSSGGSINSALSAFTAPLIRFEAGSNISFFVTTTGGGSNYATCRIAAAGGGEAGHVFTAGAQHWPSGTNVTNSHGMVIYPGYNVSIGTHAESIAGQQVLAIDIDGPPRAWLHGTNNITVLSGGSSGLYHDWTISGANTYSYGVGIGSGAQPGGSSAGTGLINNAGASGGVRLFAGSNITLSGSTGVNQFISISIFGASGGAGGEGFPFGAAAQSAAGGGMSGTGTASTGTHIGLTGGLRLYAGSNQTFSAATSANGLLSVTIHGAGGAAAPADNRYFAEMWPIMHGYETVGGIAPATTGATFWPVHPGIVNSHMTAVNWFMYMSMPSSGSASGTMDFSLGIYTRNGSTLSRMSSSYTQYRWSFNHGVNNTSYDRMKLVKVPITNMSFDQRDYWIGLSMNKSSSGQSFGASAIVAEVVSGDFAGEFGKATADTWQRVLGWGQYRSSGALPASIVFSQLNGTAATAIRAPLMYLAGYTA
jgi:hypothetical protein